nr:hypothetical protein [uncultured Dongia sp.]
MIKTLTDSVLRLIRAGYADAAIAAAFRIEVTEVATARRACGVDPVVAPHRHGLPPTRIPAPRPVLTQAPVTKSEAEEDGGPLEQPSWANDLWRAALCGARFTDFNIRRSPPGRLALPATYVPAGTMLGVAAEDRP